jgi:hypothetical protein
MDAVLRRGSRRAFQRCIDACKLIMSDEADLPSPQTFIIGNRSTNSTTSLFALSIAPSPSSNFIAAEISGALSDGIINATSVAFISVPCPSSAP